MRRIVCSLAAAVTVLALITVEPSAAGPATAKPVSATGFTSTSGLTRVHLVGGQDVVADSRQFALSVDQTTDLRGHQAVSVSWTGAHPTGGITADPTAAAARFQEYPVVVLQCQGTSAAISATDTVDPSRCWTSSGDERFQASSTTAFPSWRIDRYAPATERVAVVGQPDPRPQTCPAPALAEWWVQYRVTGTVAAGGPLGCGGQPPAAVGGSGTSLAGNATYGITQADGSGQVDVDVWSAEQNPSLGCSPTVACSLVVVPIMGISCDVTAASLPAADQPPAAEAAADDSGCRATGQYRPGQPASASTQPDLAVSGALWWSASNWRNRVVVPLAFAPPTTVCDSVSNAGQIDVYGSALMTEAMAQWTPRFCLDPTLFRIRHVVAPDQQARDFLAAGTVRAAYTSRVLDPTIVNAPVAVTGFAISFTIDDATGRAVTTLRLTPRLLAKLLSESYPALAAIKSEYAALAANPLNLSVDPEFVALNPDVPHDVAASESASTLMVPSTDSDAMFALTSYITADPEARAWLDGAADPWGMVVNPNYRGIALPLATWPVRDTFQRANYAAAPANACLAAAPAPYLPLVAAPVADLGAVADHIRFAQAGSLTRCQPAADGTSPGSLVALGRQPVGARFLLGITSLADAAEFGLDTASLQTQVTASAPVTFTSADGRSFAAPAADSMRAAAQLLTRDAASGSWPIPYTALRTNPAGAAAYPGVMVVYLQTASGGLAAVDATNLAVLLGFAAREGQIAGQGTGNLPGGYLALTAENHLQAMSDATFAAMAAVRAQVPVPEAPAQEPADESDAPTAVTTASRPSSGSSGGSSSSGSSSRPTATTSPAVVVPAVVTPIVLATLPELAPATRIPVAITDGATKPRAPAERIRSVDNRGDIRAPNLPPTDSGRTTGPTSAAAGRTLPVLLLVGLLGLLAASGLNLARRRVRR